MKKLLALTLIAGSTLTGCFGKTETKVEEPIQTNTGDGTTVVPEPVVELTQTEKYQAAARATDFPDLSGYATDQSDTLASYRLSNFDDACDDSDYE